MGLCPIALGCYLLVRTHQQIMLATIMLGRIITVNNGPYGPLLWCYMIKVKGPYGPLTWC